MTKIFGFIEIYLRVVVCVRFSDVLCLLILTVGGIEVQAVWSCNGSDAFSCYSFCGVCSGQSKKTRPRARK